MEKGVEFFVRSDCVWFKGDRPCRYWRPCMGCVDYQPVRRRVLIVMLVKLGDMLIASALPRALKSEEEGTHVTWLVDPSCAKLVRMNPYVDEVVEYSWDSICALEVCRFDLILGFERERAAAALVGKIQATEKRGLAYGGGENGLYALCSASEYFFKLNVWNDFRTNHNAKSWTEFYFELAGLKYSGEPYELQVPHRSERRAVEAASVFQREGCPFVVFNLGGSLPTKIWPHELWIDLIRIVTSWNVGVMLSYGTNECEMAIEIMSSLTREAKRKVLAPETSDDLATMAALYKHGFAVVSGDTLGMHLALWAQKPLVALFGPSNPAEVIPKETHNVVILRSAWTCSPCAHQVSCGGVGGCMGDICVDRVAEALKEHLDSAW